MSDNLLRGLDERTSDPVPIRSWTRDEALDLLRKRIDGVCVPDRSPCSKPIVFSVNPATLRMEDAYGWRADVHLSHEPCGGYSIEVDEELAILSETMLWEDGLNIFLMTEYNPPAE